MAVEEQERILRQGVQEWNQWRLENANVVANLTGVDFRKANLRKINLSNTDLSDSDFSGANLRGANLSGSYFRRGFYDKVNFNKADLTGSDFIGTSLRDATFHDTNLSEAVLAWTDLRGASFRGANLKMTGFHGADLSWTDLSGLDFSGLDLSNANLEVSNLSGSNLSAADLREANLTHAKLIGTNLSEANLSSAILVGSNLEGGNLTGCRAYGVSAWNLTLTNAIQKNIVITPEGETTIQVDRLDIAQFIYLLLRNAEIRNVIDTITSKVVLILGRFTEERKTVLDALRAALRERDYVPVLFDFDKPEARDIHETVTTLARMARFVIADITDPKSIPQELVSIVEQLPSLPVQPILLQGGHPWGMYDHIKRYPWVLPIVSYESQEVLLATLTQSVIAPAEAKVKELRTPDAASGST